MNKLILLLPALFMSAAFADTNTYIIRSTIYEEAFLVDDGLDVGDSVTLTVTVNGDVPGQIVPFPDGQFSSFVGALQSVELDAGPYSAFLSGDNVDPLSYQFSVVDALGGSLETTDSITAGAALTSNTVNDLVIYQMFMLLRGANADVIDSPLIPILELNDWNSFPESATLQISVANYPNPGLFSTYFANIEEIVLLNEMTDADSDSVPDELDNCVVVANAQQEDTDNDGYGNACDGDFNNDCITNFLDLSLFSNAFLSNDVLFDFDGNSLVNFLDLAKLTELFFLAPGPSGVTTDCQAALGSDHPNLLN